MNFQTTTRFSGFLQDTTATTALAQSFQRFPILQAEVSSRVVLCSSRRICNLFANRNIGRQNLFSQGADIHLGHPWPETRQ